MCGVQLSEDMALHKSLAVELPELAACFEPLRNKYRALAKFEVRTAAECAMHVLRLYTLLPSRTIFIFLQVPVPDAEVLQLEGLEEGLRSVQAVLAASAGTLERTKDAFCERLLRSRDAHQHSNAAMREDFVAQAPFSAEVWSESCSSPCRL